jgi:oxidase EvaA
MARKPKGAWLSDLADWVDTFRKSPTMAVEDVDLKNCEPWSIVDGVLTRPDSRFFRVIGVDNGKRHQLFIDQPEVAVMGFALADFGATRHILVQAKDEPGNQFLTQIAPTIQATKSNFESAHGGTDVPYFDFFTQPSVSRRVLNDSQSSEHGERFWKKQNRNLTVLSSEAPPPVGPRYRWFAVSDLLASLDVDFLVNTDARSVVAAAPWAELCNPGHAPFAGDSDFERLLSASFHLEGERDALSEVLTHLENARRQVQSAPTFVPVTSDRLRDVSAKEWVRFIRASSTSREVNEWSQPIYETSGVEINTLVVARRRGELVVLIRLAEELGLRTDVEWSTTSSTDNVPTIIERMLSKGETKSTLWQTEEGSRFFRSLGRFDLIDCDVEVSDDDLRDEGLHAVNLATFNRLLGTSAVTTNELRTAASLLLRWL